MFCWWLAHSGWFENLVKEDALDHQKAWCAYCHKYIELSSSGVGPLTDHVKGKKHQYALLRS